MTDPHLEDPAQQARTYPPGLMILFFTEMWERFSYYGMRALLVLFMTASIAKGGMGLTDATATAIYGLYTAGVYLACLPGGWIADRLLGAQRSVWFGGIIIAIGHFILAIPSPKTFYLGLLFIVVGTGLLKPNISAMVGELYPAERGAAARDAGFTLFYMGINLGAALGPLICSALGERLTLGERLNWHYGFAAAGVGMVLGLIQYRLGLHQLAEAGRLPGNSTPLSRNAKLGMGLAVMGILIALGLAATGTIVLNPIQLAANTTTLIVGIALLYFLCAFTVMGLDGTEKRRVAVIVALFIAAALFWAGFEQAGSSFNLFAERHTLRQLDLFQFTIPAGWFQSLGPIFVISLAPVVAAVWPWLGRRGLEPSIPVKFAWGLLLLCLGFVVMSWASKPIAGGAKVWPTWLISTYFIHTIGELCLSPVGLSSITRLAPKRMVGQMMGIWFLAASLGSLIAGQIAGQLSSEAPERMPVQYLQVMIAPAIAVVLLLLFSRKLHQWSQSNPPR